MYPNSRLDQALYHEHVVRAQHRATQARAAVYRAPSHPLRAVWVALVSLFLG